MNDTIKSWGGKLLDWLGIANIPAALTALSQLKGEPGQIIEISGADDKNSVTGLTAVDKPAGSAEGAVLYTPQNPTAEQQKQARKNIDAVSQAELEECGLTKTEKSLILALFENTAYTSDAMGDIFSQLKSLWNGGDIEPIEIGVKLGSVSYDYNKLTVSVGWEARATLVPIGQYLKKGVTYKFSLGTLATAYRYGVLVFVAASDGLKFPYPDAQKHYDGVTERIVDTGYMSTDYNYTPEVDNCVLCINFKKPNDAALTESNYAEIIEHFTVEML